MSEFQSDLEGKIVLGDHNEKVQAPDESAGPKVIYHLNSKLIEWTKCWIL
jgi:hypothetical protein